jgi:hypothetical protein
MKQGVYMGSDHPIQVAIPIALVMIGAVFFATMMRLSETIPAEHRSASPGFGWSWDFDFEDAMATAGRLGERPFPWQATATGNSLLLPLNQPLWYKGLEITYRGRTESDKFSLNVMIRSLDPNVTYRRELDVIEAKRGFKIAGHRFALVKIAPLYIRLRSEDRRG